MSGRRNSIAIGAFVVGGAAIAVAAVLFLGAGRLLRERIPYVLYFPGSVAGLAPGAPVTFRGVSVGAVTKILVQLDRESMQVRTPVFIEVYPATVTVRQKPEVQRPRAVMAALVERGLKAQLKMQSFVTGQLAVDLDFYPDAAMELVGASPEYPELPTIPSTMQQLSQAVADLPLQAIVQQVLTTMQSIDRLVSSPSTMASIQGLDVSLQELGKLLRSVESELRPTAAAAQETLRAASAAMEQSTAAALNLGKLTSDPEVARAQLRDLVQELTAAARSMRALSEYLERHPEALIRGKGTGGQP